MRRLVSTFAFGLAVAAACAGGCSKEGARPSAGTLGGVAIPSADKIYSGDASGLSALWHDILAAAQKDDRERVHELMASMIMSDDDLVALFGAERAAYLKPRYAPMIARLVNIGALELVAQIADRKYDDVEVFPVDRTQSAEAQAVLGALKTKVPVYGVRVKQKGERLGLRYDFFVYRGTGPNGRWVTGNQLGKTLIDAQAASAGADPTIEAPVKPAPDGGATGGRSRRAPGQSP